MRNKAHQRYVAGTLLVAYIFNQADRAIFSFLMEPIKRDFHLSDTALGFLAGPALVLFYAILGVPIARLADRRDRITIMSIGIGAWSMMVMVAAFAVRPWHLLLSRIGVGVAEAGFAPLAQTVLSDMHSSSERPKVLSLFMLGIPLGAVMSSLVGGWINEMYGWRAAFLAAGVPGLFLAVLVRTTIKDPRDLSFGVAEANNPLADTVRDDHQTLRALARQIWRSLTLRHMTAAMTYSTIVSAGVAAWIPTLLIRRFDVPTGELGVWIAVLALAGGCTGTWLGGFLTGRTPAGDLGKQSTIISFWTGLTTPVLFVALLLPTKTQVVTLLIPVYICMYFFHGPGYSIIQTAAPPRSKSATVAIVILAQTIFAGIGLQVIGIISDLLAPLLSRDSIRAAIIIVGCFSLLSAVHFALAARAFRASQVSPDEPSEPRSMHEEILE